MKNINFILFSIFLPWLLFSCSSDKNDQPKSIEENIIGYWALTHISTIEHSGNIHQTSDLDIPPHEEDGEPGYGIRYDVLIFDEEYVTVRGELPSIPRAKDYDLNSIEGQIAFESDLEKWYDSLGLMADLYGFPVGKYLIRGNELIINSINQGAIKFISDNKFSLEYKHPLDNPGDYIIYTYTYTRIYSLCI